MQRRMPIADPLQRKAFKQEITRKIGNNKIFAYIYRQKKHTIEIHSCCDENWQFLKRQDYVSEQE